jgi:hypothetical protein
MTGEQSRRRVNERTDATADVAVFVCSSDSRLDILERVFPSVLRHWTDCPYKIYVGLNSACARWPGVTVLEAPAADWREECLIQLAQVRESHLIVILDDFLFQRPVDQALVSRFASQALTLRIPYLRLLPLGKSVVQRLGFAAPHALADGIVEIAPTRPFYSSLQIGVWEKSHFIKMLNQGGSIWDFEHLGLPDARHYAITGTAPIVYRHLVEKGRWLPNAVDKMLAAGVPPDLGSRASWTRWRWLKLLLDELKYYVFGYAIH